MDNIDNNAIMYIATFGVLFDTLFLSLALSYKLKILKIEKESFNILNQIEYN